MSYIVALNGTDGSGKTTQIELLKQKKLKNIGFTKDVDQYGVFPKLDENAFFKWWFFQSSLPEFCQAIYTGIQKRQQEALGLDKKIVILDKGMDTFEARILANFNCRGYSTEEIKQAMQKTKQEIGFENREDVSLLLLTAREPDKRKKILQERRGKRGTITYGQDYYSRYQDKLDQVLEEQLREGKYRVIDASQKQKEVHQDIMREIMECFPDHRKEFEREE